MAAPTTATDIVTLLKKSRLLTAEQVDGYLANNPSLIEPAEIVKAMEADGLLTRFQAEQVLKGRHKGFILGKYRLLDRIGMGGMGQVYLAEHMSMRRKVAVKVLPPDRTGNPFACERFLREARAVAQLEHPNIVRAHDIETDGEVHYLVMDYIDGVTLHDLVARRGPLPVLRAVNYLIQIAAGLQAVHERSLVHRDVKPANLLLDRSGTVRILDLGLVRSELDDDALTRGEGARMVGTADYLAPEQAVESSKVDCRADLYSLGCTAYFLLTGSPPFKAEKVSQKLIAHQVHAPKPLMVHNPQVPAALSAIVLKLLAKKPKDRYASAVELVAALQPWASAPVPPPPPDDFPERKDSLMVPSPTGLSLSSRQQPAGRPLATPGRLPGLSGAGSDVRLAPSFLSPKPTQANQPTIAAAGQETLTKTPRPAMPASEPKLAAVAELPAPPKADAVQVRINALFGPQPAAQASARMAKPPAAGSGVMVVLVGLITFVAAAMAVVLALRG